MSNGTNPDVPGKQPTDGRVEQAVQTGPIALTARNENHDPVWTVDAQSGQLAIHDDENITSALKTVSGQIFQKGKTASFFTADHAFANRQSKRLSMQGNVRAQDAKKRYTLSARALDWLPDQEVIQARQNVMVIGDGFSAGPFALVWTSADLNKFGTPDMMKPGVSMSALLATLHLSAAIQQGVVFKDQVNNMEVRQLSQWLTEKIDSKSFHFKGAGNPFIADWHAQALHLEGKTIDGIAESSGKSYFLKKADVGGGVVGRLGSVDPFNLRASTLTYTGDQSGGTTILNGGVTVTQAKDKSNLTLTCGTSEFKSTTKNGVTAPVRLEAKSGCNLKLDRGPESFAVHGSSAILDFNASSWDLSLNGPISADRDFAEKGNSSHLHIEGTHAEASLNPNGGLLDVLTVTGPITFTATSTGEDNGKVTGSCRNAVYSVTYGDNQKPVSSQLKMTGAIKVNGTGTEGSAATFLGSLEAEGMTIFFNAKGEVTKFTADGAPGKATVSGDR